MTTDTTDRVLETFAEQIRAYEKEHARILALSSGERALKKAAVSSLQKLFSECGVSTSAKVRVDSTVYYYGTHSSDKIITEEWLKLYEDKLITREQFLAALSVSKTEANKSAGQDVILRITKTVVGTEFDIRSEKSSNTEEGTELILPAKKPNVAPRKLGVKTKVVGGQRVVTNIRK